MTVKIKHSGNIGDIIYSLPAIRQATRNAEEKAELLLLIDQPMSHNYDHPNGSVMLTRKIAEMAIPLFEALPFIESCRIIEFAEPVDYDFDAFRNINHPYSGSISRWYFHTFPELTCDLSEPLELRLPNDVKIPKTRPVIFNRTTRYPGHNIDYLVISKYSHLMTFVGLPEEYDRIKRKLPEMDYRPVENFLELALLILNAQFFVGNQSMAFAIAEVFKFPRAVEVCRFAHNVIPHGGEAYDIWDMGNLRKIFEAKFADRLVLTHEPY